MSVSALKGSIDIWEISPSYSSRGFVFLYLVTHTARAKTQVLAATDDRSCKRLLQLSGSAQRDLFEQVRANMSRATDDRLIKSLRVLLS